jgi:hypothetical protein
MLRELIDKIKTWYANKQEEAYPLTPDIGDDAPDTSEDTMREMESKDEATRHWVNLFNIHF